MVDKTDYLVCETGKSDKDKVSNKGAFETSNSHKKDDKEQKIFIADYGVNMGRDIEDKSEDVLTEDMLIGDIEQERNDKIKIKKRRKKRKLLLSFAMLKNNKKIHKKLHKILANKGKTCEKTDSVFNNVENMQKNTQKIGKNIQPSASKTFYYAQNAGTFNCKKEAQNVVFEPQNEEKSAVELGENKKHLVELERENKELKKENLALKQVKNRHKERGFGYVEILGPSIRKNKERDRLLNEFQEEKIRENEKKKVEEREREIKEEKIHDLIRQKKDIQYGLGYTQRKAEYWRNLSEVAYKNAIMHIFSGESKSRGLFGINKYSLYMGMSIGAMKYCMDYQKDLDKEMQEILRKEKELEKLMQR